MTESISRWRTISVTALPQPYDVALNCDGDAHTFDAPVALLRKNTITGDTRVVLGVVNEERGEIEPVDPDWEDEGRLGDFMYAVPRGQ